MVHCARRGHVRGSPLQGRTHFSAVVPTSLTPYAFLERSFINLKTSFTLPLSSRWQFPFSPSPLPSPDNSSQTDPGSFALGFCGDFINGSGQLSCLNPGQAVSFRFLLGADHVWLLLNSQHFTHLPQLFLSSLSFSLLTWPNVN